MGVIVEMHHFHIVDYIEARVMKTKQMLVVVELILLEAENFGILQINNKLLLLHYVEHSTNHLIF